MDDRIASLFRLYDGREGTRDYVSEVVSQRAHALQAAQRAREAAAPDAEIAAALLHDVGHLCADPGAPRMGDAGVEGHEDLGADHLASLGFPPAVTGPVRRHVIAKRYLVVRRREYAERLSAASRQTLAFQGGPLTEEECRAFEADPLSASALRLRSWDEAAKLPGLDVPGLESYRGLLESLIRHRS